MVIINMFVIVWLMYCFTTLLDNTNKVVFLLFETYKDLLTSVNGVTITYDETTLNPISIGNDITLSFKGRNPSEYIDITNNIYIMKIEYCKLMKFLGGLYEKTASVTITFLLTFFCRLLLSRAAGSAFGK